MRRITVVELAVVALAGLAIAVSHAAQPSAFGPGQRVLLDAHNAYPERGQWADRIERALSTGTPVAIEQDLYWYRPRGDSVKQPVVAHDDDALDGAPTLRAHFFERIRPIMERALRENRRETWPVLVLNLDFKENQPEHLDAVWSLLQEYRSWLTTAPRTGTLQRVEPFIVGPLLVLSGSDTAQRRRFHDDVPVGQSLLAFGATVPVKVPGTTKGQRARNAVRMSAAQHIASPADNYARWINFPWSVIEAGGQNNAKDWTAADAARLVTFARRAHAQGLWLRFYTLDGVAPNDDRGWTSSYNFGSLAAAQSRWQAAIAAGVDFIATDQYEEFTASRAGGHR
jgi:hypothetical protein